MQAWRAILGVAGSRHAAPPPPDPLPDGPLEFQPYVVFDLETTGLRPSLSDDIVQIGAVRLDSGVETRAFDMLVNPGRPIPPASSRYHGITDAMVAGAPGTAEAVSAFRDFAAGAVLVAHNAAFDGTALRAAAERHGAPHLPNPLLCSMALAAWLDPQERDTSLGGLCGRAGIVIEHRHQALGDARATAELWLRLLARAGARGVADLAELARRTRMRDQMEDSAKLF